jgi:hypothetical protein
MNHLPWQLRYSTYRGVISLNLGNGEVFPLVIYDELATNADLMAGKLSL